MSTEAGETSASGGAGGQELRDDTEQQILDPVQQGPNGRSRLTRLRIPRRLPRPIRRHDVVEVPGELSNARPASLGLGLLQISAAQAQRQWGQIPRPSQSAQQQESQDSEGRLRVLDAIVRPEDGTNENERPPERPPAYSVQPQRAPDLNIATVMQGSVPAPNVPSVPVEHPNPANEDRDVFQWARMHEQLQKDNQARKDELSSFIAGQNSRQAESSARGAAGPLAERPLAESNVRKRENREAVEAAAAVTLRKPPFSEAVHTAQGDLQMRTLEEASGIILGNKPQPKKPTESETTSGGTSTPNQPSLKSSDRSDYIPVETSALPPSITPEQALEPVAPADNESLRTPPPSQRRDPSISPTPSGQREGTIGRKWSKFSWALRSKARSKSKDEEYDPTDPRGDEFEDSPTSPYTPVESAGTSGPSRRQSSRTSIGSAMMMLIRWKHSRSSAGDQKSPITEERGPSHKQSCYDIADESGADAGIETKRRHNLEKFKDMAKKLFDTRKKPQPYFPGFSQTNSEENNLINEAAQMARERRSLPRSWKSETGESAEDEGLRHAGRRFNSSPDSLARALKRVDLSKLRKRHTINYQGRRYTVQFPLDLEGEQQSHPALRGAPLMEATPQVQLRQNKIRFEQIAQSNILDADFQEAQTVGASSRENRKCKYGTF